MLIDFGLTIYSLAEQDSSLKEDSATVQYSSPERIDDLPSLKEDIWALGVILYYLSTFKMPFDSENKKISAIMRKITDT